MKPSNNYVCLAGDSRTANGFDVATDGRWFLEMRGAAAWARAMSGNRFQQRRTHYGVGGDTTADILARWSTVLADPAGSIFALFSANDRGSANMTAQQTIDNITSMINQAKAAGKVMHLANELPYNALTGTQLANHIAVHNWLNTCEALFPNVYVVDTWSRALDPTTDGTTYQYKSGLASDGLHPSTEGGFQVLGPAFASSILRVMHADLSTPWVSGESVSYPALNANPGMTGESGLKGSYGTVQGVIADNWRGDFASTDTAAICDCTKETIDGVVHQVLTFSGTVGSSGTFTFRPTTELPYDGNAFDFRARIKLGAGSSNIIGVSAEARSNGTVTQNSRALDGYTSPQMVPAAGFDLHFWTPPCAEAASPTAKRGNVVITFNPNSAISGVVKIANAASRRVA